MSDPRRPTSAPGAGADVVDPALALRWLGLARRVTLAAQALIMIAAEAGTELHLHSPALLFVVTAWAVWDLGQAAWLRRRLAPGRVVLATAGVDLGALTAILALSGGPHHPLLFGYLAWIALLAMVLPATQAWLATGLAIILEGAVVWEPSSGDGFAGVVMTPTHLLSDVVTFDVSAVTITWVVTRLSAALRQRSLAELEAQRRLASAERLAALGTLAAGVAHELGTPLGTIQLLAERARQRAPDEDGAQQLGTLLEQVARCRSILDRLRGRDAPSGPDASLDLPLWITEWRRGQEGIEVRSPDPFEPVLVQGAPESWRAALWVAMDNALRAGARRITVSAHLSPEQVEVHVEDDGHGLSAEDAAHVGEPFWTGWGGTGLGLFVARSFAQSVGGDVIVEPNEAGGARTRLLIRRVMP